MYIFPPEIAGDSDTFVVRLEQTRGLPRESAQEGEISARACGTCMIALRVTYTKHLLLRSLWQLASLHVAPWLHSLLACGTWQLASSTCGSVAFWHVARASLHCVFDIHIYIYIYIGVCIYIYIYIEREREMYLHNVRRASGLSAPHPSAQE